MRALFLVSFLFLAGCGAESLPTRPAASFTPATRSTATGLIGVDARALQRQFGKPRLDIRDPTAHKLQFANDRCVLDAYLYAPGTNREPVVTFVEARGPQGATLDANACAKLLREGQ